MIFRNMFQRLQARLAPGHAGAATTEEEAPLPTDTGRPTRMGLWVLIIGLGGFLLWAAYAPIDEGVPTQGTVAIDTKRKAIQHLSGGIVREVKVKEGDFVSEGQVLIKLDDAMSRAGYESVRQHYLTLRAMESRLQAEQAGLQSIAFHPDLHKAAGDPLVSMFMANQTQLFQSRRAALQSELQAIQESVHGQQGSLRGLEGTLPHRKNQLALLREELTSVRELVREGYAPLRQQLDLERRADDISVSVSEIEGNIVKLQRGIDELGFRTAQRRHEFQKEVNSQLVDVRREVQADAEKFKAASEDLGRVEIRAPVAGQVVGLAVQTVGGVIQPSQKLMDIVPANEQLLIETRLPPHVIDRAKPGELVNIRFSGFAHAPQLVVQGKIISISEDLLTDQATQQSYYLARIAVTDEGRKKLGHRQMQAGMPVDVVIITGERSLVTYLLHPLLKRLASSMVEE